MLVFLCYDNVPHILETLEDRLQEISDPAMSTALIEKVVEIEKEKKLVDDRNEKFGRKR